MVNFRLIYYHAKIKTYCSNIRTLIKCSKLLECESRIALVLNLLHSILNSKDNSYFQTIAKNARNARNSRKMKRLRYHGNHSGSSNNNSNNNNSKSRKGKGKNKEKIENLREINKEEVKIKKDHILIVILEIVMIMMEDLMIVMVILLI